jgi:hypothetical protein
MVLMFYFVTINFGFFEVRRSASRLELTILRNFQLHLINSTILLHGTSIFTDLADFLPAPPGSSQY